MSSRLHDDLLLLVEHVQAAADRIDTLETALREIANCENIGRIPPEPYCEECVRIARAALEATDE